MDKIYWRPICQSVSDLQADGARLAPLAGCEGIGFHSLERLCVQGAKVSASMCCLNELGGQFQDVLTTLGEARPALAGLAMARVQIMGIVNVTPDSFSDGGAFFDADAAIAHGLELWREGATLLDVGGESTRPGADFVPPSVEIERVVPVIKALSSQTNAVISIDTRKAEVMAAAVAAGASMINDVSALSFDPEAIAVAASLKVPVILMHAQGQPQTMQDDPFYEHVLTEVYDYLKERVEAAIAGGIDKRLLVIDPGIGFGKTSAHNMALLDGLSLFHGIGVPVLLGCSRKRFIAALSQGEPALERLPGSLAGVLKGVSQGVQIVRVHDVAATRQALAVWHGAG